MNWLVRAGFCALALGACGDDEGSKGITDWGGDAAHLTARGAVNGEKVTLDLDAAAVSEGQILCQFEYTVPALPNGEPDYANGRMTEIKIEGLADVNGEKRGIEIELKRHDFQKDAPGTVVKIVPRDDLKDPGAGEAWLEWEWHDAVSDEELYQASAIAGEIKLELLSGTPDATGLLLENARVGVTFSGRWSETESMDASITVDCREPAVEIVQ